jgi:predicted outer membrane protein
MTKKFLEEPKMLTPQQMNHHSKTLSPANFQFDSLPVATKRQLHQETCQIVREVAKRNLVENGLALIQTTAMNNIANLSVLEAQLLEICPHAENRLRMLVDNYTLRADKRLGGN